MIVALGGVEAIVFTGGIGEKGAGIRSAVCADLEELGIVIDSAANQAVRGEGTFHMPTSRTELWVIPTNEEVIVARQCVEVLDQS
jgi:acetate kinase